MNFKGKIFAIPGGGRGIGRAIADSLDGRARGAAAICCN